mgnify:CR=1 FL=1
MERDGDLLEVSSWRGEGEGEGEADGEVLPGVVFMTFHFAETPTNVLTNPALDPVAKIPELKVCAVSLSKAVGD